MVYKLRGFIIIFPGSTRKYNLRVYVKLYELKESKQKFHCKIHKNLKILNMRYYVGMKSQVFWEVYHKGVYERF